MAGADRLLLRSTGPAGFSRSAGPLSVDLTAEFFKLLHEPVELFLQIPDALLAIARCIRAFEFLAKSVKRAGLV